MDDKRSPDPGSEAGVSRKSRRRWLLGGLLAGGLFGSLATLSAGLHAQMAGPFGLHRVGHGHHGGWMGRDLNPEALAERLDFATDWALTRVGANDGQRARVKAIVQAAAGDLSGLRLQHRENRAALVEALQAPAIDRAALEALRRAELQLAETASARLLAAVADAAEVLTPEQRARLAEGLARHRHGA